MTCVAGARTKTEAWIAYDCASSSKHEMSLTSSPKAFKHAGGGIMGSAGSWIVLDILKELKGSDCEPRDIAAALDTLRENNPKALKDGVDIIMVAPGKPIIYIDGDGASVEIRPSFYAIGTGAPYALGYLEGCATVGPEELKRAVKIAAKYHPGVAEPVTLLSVKKASSTTRVKKEDLTPTSKSAMVDPSPRMGRD